jgi:hypothetical protein
MAIQNRLNKGLKELSEDYGELLVKTLKKNLKRLGKDASGSLINSMYYEVKEADGKTSVKIFAEEYLRYVDKGRKPGKFPNITAISKWANARGISQRAVFPIARSIAEKGIKKTDVINISIREVQKIFIPLAEKELKNMVGVILANDIFSETNTKGRIVPTKLR